MYTERAAVPEGVRQVHPQSDPAPAHYPRQLSLHSSQFKAKIVFRDVLGNVFFRFRLSLVFGLK